MPISSSIIYDRPLIILNNNMILYVLSKIYGCVHNTHTSLYLAEPLQNQYMRFGKPTMDVFNLTNDLTLCLTKNGLKNCLPYNLDPFLCVIIQHLNTIVKCICHFPGYMIVYCFQYSIQCRLLNLFINKMFVILVVSCSLCPCCKCV